MTRKKIFTIAAGVLVLLGVTLGVRLYDLGATSFVADEFLDMNGSMGYTKTDVWQSWDFNYGVPATQNLNEARDERAYGGSSALRSRRASGRDCACRRAGRRKRDQLGRRRLGGHPHVGRDGRFCARALDADRGSALDR